MTWNLMGDISYQALKSAANQVSLTKEGIIYARYWGDQTASTVSRSSEKVKELIHQLQLKGKPVLILSDITKIAKINLGARKAGLEYIKALTYEKLAIVGVNFLTQQLVKAVVTASGMSFKVKIFDNQKEAKKWLLS